MSRSRPTEGRGRRTASRTRLERASIRRWRFPPGAEVIDKGTLQAEDAYSGFQGTDLASKLNGLHVKRIYVAGLATDYCVKNTVLDGAAQGFETYVVTDCVRGVNLKRTDSATALRAMLSRGARQTTSGRLLKSPGLASDDLASVPMS